MYRTRVRSSFSGTSSDITLSMPHRNAARVLPLPVGARIRLWRPSAIADHPSVWAAVGSANEVVNHSRTTGENLSNAIVRA